MFAPLLKEISQMCVNPEATRRSTAISCPSAGQQMRAVSR